MVEQLTKITLLPYLLVITAVCLYILESSFTPFVLMFFILAASTRIDDQTGEPGDERERSIVSSNYQLAFKVFLSQSIVLLIIHNFFIPLSASLVFALMLMIPLVVLLLLNDIRLK